MVWVLAGLVVFGILNGDIATAFGSIIRTTDRALYGSEVSASRTYHICEKKLLSFLRPMDGRLFEVGFYSRLLLQTQDGDFFSRLCYKYGN